MPRSSHLTKATFTLTGCLCIIILLYPLGTLIKHAYTLICVNCVDIYQKKVHFLFLQRERKHVAHTAFSVVALKEYVDTFGEASGALNVVSVISLSIS